jgi:hypothetical protein
MKKTKIILVDADSLCFVGGNDPIEIAYDKLESKINKLYNFYPDKIVCLYFYLTMGKSFRNDIYTDYKGNRKSERSENVSLLKQYLIDGYEAEYKEGFEADDLVYDRYRTNPKEYTIASVDKDLLYNIEGEHINLYNMSIVKITKDEAEYNFYRQVIKGDPTDNIPNLLKGFGDSRLEQYSKMSGKSMKYMSMYFCSRLGIDYTNRFRLLYCGDSSNIKIDIPDMDDNDILNECFSISEICKKHIKKSIEVKKVNKNKQNNKISKDREYTNIIEFGKHKGMSFSDLFTEDNSYFMWLYNNTKDINLKNKLEEIKEKNDF